MSLQGQALGSFGSAEFRAPLVISSVGESSALPCPRCWPNWASDGLC